MAARNSNPNPSDVAGVFGKVLVGVGIAGLVGAGVSYGVVRARRASWLVRVATSGATEETQVEEAQTGSFQQQSVGVVALEAVDPFPPPLGPGVGGVGI